MPTIDNWRALQETVAFAERIQAQSMEMEPAAIRSLLDERDRLAAEVEALRADAWRYRFIKQCSPEPRVGDICPAILLFGLQGYPEDQWNNSALESKNLDAAIDAAMKGKP